MTSFTCVQRALVQEPSQVRLHALLDDVQGAELGRVPWQGSPVWPQHLVDSHHVVVVQPPGDFNLPQRVFHHHRVPHQQLLDGHPPPSALVHSREHQACDAHAKRLKVNEVTAQVEAVGEEGRVLSGHGGSPWRSQRETADSASH